MHPTIISTFSLFSTIFYSNSPKMLTAQRIIYKLEQMDTDFSKKYLVSVLDCSHFYIKTSLAMYFSIRYAEFSQWDTKASSHLRIICHLRFSSRVKAGANLEPSYFSQMSYGCKVLVQEILRQEFWSQQTTCKERKGNSKIPK